jgi:uncharacterized membrane protein YeiH
MEIIMILNVIGIAAFSIAGAFAAMEKKLELLSICLVAFVTALGGGTLRDVLIGEMPVRWMRDLSQVGIVTFSTITVLFFANGIKKFRKMLLLFDSLGLAFFTLVGIQQGIALELPPLKCIALGTITACFGGVIRDILLNKIPLIFQKEIYATACIFGGIIYFLLLRAGVPTVPIDAVCITAIVAVRLLAIRYNLHLPVVKHSKDGRKMNG